MSKVNAKIRPTSPHLQVYKFQINMFASIFGRACGFVSFATIISLAWLMMFDLFGSYGLTKTIVEKTLLSTSSLVFGLSLFFIACLLFANVFYFMALVRHFLWDCGYLLDLSAAKKSSYTMLFLSFIIAIFCAYLIGQSFYQLRLVAVSAMM
jgi:succinate dehydrogenase / fumarate reductase, cytochrome b subunit